jgi:hypothetical protein
MIGFLASHLFSSCPHTLYVVTFRSNLCRAREGRSRILSIQAGIEEAGPHSPWSRRVDLGLIHVRPVATACNNGHRLGLDIEMRPYS